MSSLSSRFFFSCLSGHLILAFFFPWPFRLSPAVTHSTQLYVGDQHLSLFRKYAEVSFQTFKRGGVVAFFSGLTPRLLKRSLSSAAVWSMLEWILDKMHRRGHPPH